MIFGCLNCLCFACLCCAYGVLLVILVIVCLCLWGCFGVADDSLSFLGFYV